MSKDVVINVFLIVCPKSLMQDGFKDRTQ